jgi:hypothetical protein
MNRIWDYSNFAIRYAGAGYTARWPLSSSGVGGKLFGASLVCREGTFALMGLLCRAPHPLQLSPGLHVLGFLAAALVIMQLILHAVRRTRRLVGSGAIHGPAQAAHLPMATPRRRKPVEALHQVKPRAHFGLRNMPQ